MKSEAEEFTPPGFERRHHKAAVEVLVEPLAGSFRDVQTAMTGISRNPVNAPVTDATRGTDRIIRAETARLDSLENLPADILSGIHEATERAFRPSG
jgi:hypothetical protein